MRKVAERAVREFNERFAPETTAELISVDEVRRRIAVKFTRVCTTCGMYDYFLDFLEILEDLSGRKFHIVEEEVVHDPLVWIIVFAEGEGRHRHVLRAEIIEYDESWNVCRIQRIELGEESPDDHDREL